VKYHVQTISPSNPHYPPLLRQIHDPPKTLYVRGNLDILTYDKLLAVVGSRKNSHYGRQVMEKILTPAVEAGLILVSGFAHGIDTLAHKICLTQKQPTIAVLGSGLNDDAVYPSTNRSLIKEIITTGGALVSEYPPSTKAQQYHFPQRNRVIAGLTPATLVIQARQKSGSLITARLALESNRDVAAIPGPITDPLSQGTNWLIQQGAHVITKPADLLHFYDLEEPTTTPTNLSQLSLDQANLLKHISADAQHVDQLIEQASLSAPQVSGLLLELELAGAIENIGGMRYVRK